MNKSGSPHPETVMLRRAGVDGLCRLPTASHSAETRCVSAQKAAARHTRKASPHGHWYRSRPMAGQCHRFDANVGQFTLMTKWYSVVTPNDGPYPPYEPWISL